MKQKFDETDFDPAIISVDGDNEIIGLYTCTRVDRDSLPQGFYAYDIRENDDGDNAYCTVENYVVVNHTGTIVTREEIPMLVNTKITVNGETSIDSYSDIKYFDPDDEDYNNDWRKEFIRE